MTMQKTIDIPANRKVHDEPNGSLDLEAPETPPANAAGMDPRLIGAVNPALRDTIEIVGDIIGPFHDEWENGY